MDVYLIICTLYVGTTEFIYMLGKKKNLFAPLFIWYWLSISMIIIEFDIKYPNYPLSSIVKNDMKNNGLLFLIMLMIISNIMDKFRINKKIYNHKKKNIMKALLVLFSTIIISSNDSGLRYSINQIYILILVFLNFIVMAFILVVNNYKNKLEGMAIKLYCITNILLTIIILLGGKIYERYEFIFNRYMLYGFWSITIAYIMLYIFFGKRLIYEKKQ